MALMSPFGRLCVRNVQSLRQGFQSIRRSATSAEAKEEMLAYWQKNQQLGRPLAPYHKYLFGSRLTSNTSITHRISGIGIGIVIPSFGVFCLVKSKPFSHYVDKLDFGQVIGTATKFIVAWPLVYHYLNGMRHLSWDMAWGFKMATINKTGWTASILSVLIAGTFAVIHLDKSTRHKFTKSADESPS